VVVVVGWGTVVVDASGVVVVVDGTLVEVVVELGTVVVVGGTVVDVVVVGATVVEVSGRVDAVAERRAPDWAPASDPAQAGAGVEVASPKVSRRATPARARPPVPDRARPERWAPRSKCPSPGVEVVTTVV
jgi:pyruvate/2-oxoglutarate dehydrogenase complex dihydrolipoamide acyltransferase (E2) component